MRSWILCLCLVVAILESVSTDETTPDGSATAVGTGTATADTSGSATVGTGDATVTGDAATSNSDTASSVDSGSAGSAAPATAGDGGTATLGNEGTATASGAATATGSVDGTAVLGDVAPATVGDVAPATVADVAPATVGDVAPSAVGDVSPAVTGDVAPATVVDDAVASVDGILDSAVSIGEAAGDAATSTVDESPVTMTGSESVAVAQPGVTTTASQTILAGGKVIGSGTSITSSVNPNRGFPFGPGPVVIVPGTNTGNAGTAAINGGPAGGVSSGIGGAGGGFPFGPGTVVVPSGGGGGGGEGGGGFPFGSGNVVVPSGFSGGGSSSGSDSGVVPFLGVPTGFLCPMKFGRFADPITCNRYIGCWNGIGYLNQCPKKYVFSEYGQICVLQPFNGCGAKPIQNLLKGTSKLGSSFSRKINGIFTNFKNQVQQNPLGGFKNAQQNPAGGFKNAQQKPVGGFKNVQQNPLGGWKNTQQIPLGGWKN